MIFVWSISRAPESAIFEVRAWRHFFPHGWCPSTTRVLATSFQAARAMLPARSQWASTTDAGTPAEVEWWQTAARPLDRA